MQHVLSRAKPGPDFRTLRGYSCRYDDALEEDQRALEAVAARNGFPVPTTADQAHIFMQAVMGIRIFESAGLGRGETKGELVGYSTTSSTATTTAAPTVPCLLAHARRSC